MKIAYPHHTRRNVRTSKSSFGFPTRSRHHRLTEQAVAMMRGRMVSAKADMV
jgi:hypothetical protein